MDTVRVDSRASRLVIDRNGIESIVHCARVGDRWWIHLDGHVHVVDLIEPGAVNASDAEGAFTAPMPGKVLDVLVPEGAKVREGQDLMVLEAMKMEHRIAADRDGVLLSRFISKKATRWMPGQCSLISLEKNDSIGIHLDLNLIFQLEIKITNWFFADIQVHSYVGVIFSNPNPPVFFLKLFHDCDKSPTCCYSSGI